MGKHKCHGFNFNVMYQEIYFHIYNEVCDHCFKFKFKFFINKESSIRNKHI